MPTLLRILRAGLVSATLLLSACATRTTSPAATAAGAAAIVPIAYRGWPDALRLENAHVEAIVVPAIGRVMSFRFRDGSNVLWEDPSLSGQSGDPSGKSWINFGGDKTWPSPEAEWKNYTGRKEWMPPPAFDA